MIGQKILRLFHPLRSESEACQDALNNFIIGLQNILAAVKSFDVSWVSAEISDALCLSSTARATVTEIEQKDHQFT